jgi:hypothetical protein
MALYGFRKDKDAVGDTLSAAELYLQHPTAYDPGVEYINPQYLLRPGAQMPKLEQIFSATSISDPQQELLNDSQKRQVYQIFDSAVGPSTFSELLQSPRLQTPLKE